MKKIGILTFHRATNYGAVLQSYSFINRLKQDFPTVDFEIIDYSTVSAREDHLKLIALNSVRYGLRAGIDETQKNIMFNKFSNSLPISEYKIVSNDIQRVMKEISKRYDAVICGSDAVFSWRGKRFPTAYLLGENINVVKMSYAASAHGLNYRDASSHEKEYCMDAFKSYDYIGIRDKETEEFVKYFFPGAITHHNCDPTILLNIDDIKPQYDILEKYHIETDKPIMMIMTPNCSIGETLVKEYGEKYSIISLFVRNKAVDQFLPCLDPFEWAYIFHYAKIVVTEYFHATIFALLNGKNVLSIDRRMESKGYIGKINDLLNIRLDLPEYYLNFEHYTSNRMIERIDSIVDCDNRDRIFSRIEKEKSGYMDFYNSLNDQINARS